MRLLRPTLKRLPSLIAFVLCVSAFFVTMATVKASDEAAEAECVCSSKGVGGIGVPGVNVRSMSNGVGGMGVSGVPGTMVRFISGGVGGDVGVVVIKNSKGISANIFIGEQV